MAKIHWCASTVTGDAEHLPLVMDCDRRNFRFRAVAKTFDKLEIERATASARRRAHRHGGSHSPTSVLYAEAIEL